MAPGGIDSWSGAHPGRFLPVLAYAAVAATYALIVLGGVVRATGSGLGCPDWPLCHGQLVPPPEQAAIVEYSHRALAGIASLLAVAAVVVWVRARRASAGALAIGSGIVGLLIGQIALGAATVALELPPLIVLAHLGLAMLFLGALTALAVEASGPFASVAKSPHPHGRQDARFRRQAVGAAIAVYVLILTGAYVRASGATWACAGFPTCNDELLPFGAGRLVDIHLLHRLVAVAVAAHLVVTIIGAFRSQRHNPAARAAAALVAGFLVAQFTIGAWLVSTGAPPLAQVLHIGGAAGLWAASVALLVVTLNTRPEPARISGGTSPPAFEAAATQTDASAWVAPSLVSKGNPKLLLEAYVSLTKPRIVFLLLLTTLCAMVMAERGVPPWPLVLLTLLGGALGAGGANAMNCWLDRDIDAIMARTESRAIPAGLIRPAHAAWFGIGLAAASFVVLAGFVNLLSAVLTLAAFGFYVVVYTRWLKRSSVHNIVIGGAAGAVPPVVGWAAVTGEVSALALALFAIVFIWTPPHFWALALILKGDYARAHVPMLPVVRGEDETRRQIVVYAALLAASTMGVYFLGLLGVVYFVGALALGGLFVAYAWRLLKEATEAAARRLFRYSIVYLALIFTVMVVDRQVWP